MNQHAIPQREAILARIDELEAGKARLMRKLKRSFAIQQLWPDAFAHGGVTSRLVTCMGKPTQLLIRNALGEERSFKGADVPAILLDGLGAE